MEDWRGFEVSKELADECKNYLRDWNYKFETSGVGNNYVCFEVLAEDDTFLWELKRHLELKGLI